MVNIQKLKGRVKEKGLTLDELAKDVGMHPATLYRKLQDAGNNFTIEEAAAIIKVLNLNYDDVNDIFFAHIVA